MGDVPFPTRCLAISLSLLPCLAVNASGGEHANVSEPAKTKKLPSEQREFFESRIRPVLARHCYECHSDSTKELKAELRLDTAEGVRRGGKSGAIVQPGKPGKSRLIEALRHDKLRMPPKKKLSDKIIRDFEVWVRMGIPDPRHDQSKSGSQLSSSDDSPPQGLWSLEQPRPSAPPLVNERGWVKRKHDAFILAKLEANGLAPNAPADRRELIRRVTFDLTGLPPTPREVDAFLADESPEAYQRLVDSLLASPHYGERWARLWLDVARYAEDQAHIVGNNKSLFYPNAYLYRDWVIRALNNDVPFDQFVRLQLAADLINDVNDSNLAALGFMGLGPKYYRRNAPEVMAEEWADRVDTVTRGLLGMTVACAQCHDHKDDPISTEDYYGLAGVFASSQMFNRPIDDKRDKGGDGQAKNPNESLHIIRDGKPVDLNVYVRGDVTQKGALVKRRFPAVLLGGSTRPLDQGSGRLQLADAIVDRKNPLTARVLVNRVWAQYFGNGLVDTPSNFGSLGSRPTHPRLLDDLAVRFMESGWSMKWLHRELVMSATYRQSSRSQPGQNEVDPANRLLARMPKRRLSIEQWRDAILAASGSLDAQVGGKSIDPSDPSQTRRTIYSEVSRFDVNPMLALMDFPDPNAHAASRTETTTALQKLFMVNSTFMLAQADRLVKAVQSDAADTPSRVEHLYRRLYQRKPTPAERRLAHAFLDSGQKEVDSSRWVQYAQVLLASNELLFLD